MIDRLFPAAQVRHEYVLSVDELGRLAGGPVTTLSNAHDLPRHAKMLQDGVSEEGPAIHHVHVLHRFADLIHGHVAVDGGDAVALEHTPEPLKPFRPEPLPLVLGALRHGYNQVRGGVVEEEALLEFRGVLIGFDLIRQGLRLAQSALERVQRVQILHHEHIVNGNIHQKAVGEPDRVVRVILVRGHLDPMRRDRPELRRDTERRLLDDEISLALELEVNLQEAPQGSVAHLVERVRVRPEVEEWVGGELVLFSVFVHTVELPLGEREVRGYALDDREARARSVRLNPFLGVPLRRVCPAGQHDTLALVRAACTPSAAPIPKRHGYSPPLLLGFLPSTCTALGLEGPPVIFCQIARASFMVPARIYFIGQPSADTR